MNPLGAARLQYQEALKRAGVPARTRREVNDRIARRLSEARKGVKP